ncbi:DEAD-box ATP-dependent RNA helicase 17 [Sesamum angolense]|uniref:ATP-dependent RNA helicase n=1 Tax=Sesamum angolense TaxID=2727404 RepID=A0AAE2BT50_9LAMI|nr:DEAD-box ATP-dependent RNA helicase 17 [Sesamum angolense]
MEQRSKSSGGKLKEESKNSSEVFASCSFSSLGLHSTLCDQLKERLGFEVPTQVQAQAIPVVLSGRHVLVNAATGTGKTVAYLAPIIHLLQNYDKRIQRSDGTFALVLVPTRELCMQVYEILQKLLHRFHWIVPGYIMGGENRSKEKARLRKGVSILVATPGRLLDHLKNTSSFVHTNLRWIVFDEADRILELGLENPVMIGLDDKKILQNVNRNRISLEPDMADRVEESRKMLSSSAEEYKLPAQLVQRYIKVPCGSRLVVLLSILKHLFEREASQKTFKTEKSALLLSTDVSARGLDFPKVRCIIQYDSPGEATEYVHRVGRTARLGEKGDSILFLQPIEVDYMMDLEKHGVTLAEYPLLKLLNSFPLYGPKHQLKLKKLAKDAFCSWVRAYTAHRGELKQIFMVKKLHLGHVRKVLH